MISWLYFLEQIVHRITECETFPDESAVCMTGNGFAGQSGHKEEEEAITINAILALAR